MDQREWKIPKGANGATIAPDAIGERAPRIDGYADWLSRRAGHACKLERKTRRKGQRKHILSTREMPAH